MNNNYLNNNIQINMLTWWSINKMCVPIINIIYYIS